MEPVAATQGRGGPLRKEAADSWSPPASHLAQPLGHTSSHGTSMPSVSPGTWNSLLTFHPPHDYLPSTQIKSLGAGGRSWTRRGTKPSLGHPGNKQLHVMEENKEPLRCRHPGESPHDPGQLMCRKAPPQRSPLRECTTAEGWVIGQLWQISPNGYGARD